MSAESLALARAETELVETLRRLQQCRRELDESRHDAAVVARLRLEIEALDASRDTGLRNAENAILRARAPALPPASGSGSVPCSDPDESKPFFRYDKIAQRYKLKYCHRTPESNTRLLTLIVLFSLCLWYFVVQMQKLDSSHRNPLVQSTQIPRDVITSPAVYVCDGPSSRFPRGGSPVYRNGACFYGGFSRTEDCTPDIKIAEVFFRLGFVSHACLILPSVTFYNHGLISFPFMSFSFAVNDTLAVGTLQDLPPQNGLLLADTMDFSGNTGVTLLKFAPKSFTFLNGTVARSSEAFVSNTANIDGSTRITLVVEPLRWSIDALTEVQTFTLLDLLGSFAGILGLARAAFLFIAGKGVYSPRGFMHFVLRSKHDASHVISADTEMIHMHPYIRESASVTDGSYASSSTLEAKLLDNQPSHI